VLGEHLSVKAAEEYSGYNQQYLRRLLRGGRLEGVKIGQVWLTKLTSLHAHLRKGKMAWDRRYGPHRAMPEARKRVAA